MTFGSPLLLAFTFAGPGMLGGLALAGLPIVIHMLYRQRFREVDWAAIEWLLEAIKKQSRRLRLEQFLLLALRTLLIALVVFAMAKPLLGDRLSALPLLATVDRPVTHTVLVFDNSLSMHYAPGATTRWEKAKKLAQSVLEDAAKGDLASVVVLGTAPQLLVKEPSQNLEEVVREIDGLKPQHGLARLEPAVEQIAATLRLSRAARKRIVLITDLQRQLFTAADGKSESAELPKQLQGLQNFTKDFIVLDAGDANAPNSAVVGLEQVDPLAIVGRQTLYRASLANYSASPKENALVEFVVEGQVESTQRVTLPPAGEVRQVTFAIAFPEAGDKAVEVRLELDGLKIDNSRYLGVRVRDAVKILLVDGKPSGEPFQGATDYLKVALAPDEGGYFKPTVRPESDLLETKLDDWDAVLLVNIAQFSAAEAQALGDYLKRGGSLGFILGGQTNLQAYNQTLGPDGANVLPVRLVDFRGDVTAKDKPIRFDPLGYKHSLVASFAENTAAGLLTAASYRYVKLEPYTLPSGEKAPVTTALGFTGGDPAVVFARSGNGAVCVVATSADLEWNRWPISPSYLPVMQNAVRDLVAPQLRRPQAIVGEPLVVSLPRAPGELAASVTPPGQSTGNALSVEQVAGVPTVAVPGADLAGIYALTLGKPIDQTWKLAVNTPPSESDLARVSEGDLKALLPGFNVLVRDAWTGETARASTATAAGEAGLHRHCLWLALVFLFLETALAWRCGYHR